MTRKLVGFGALTLAVMLTVDSVQGGSGSWGGCGAPCYAPAVQIAYVDQVVMAYRPVWKQRQVPTTVYRVVTNEVEETINTTVLEQKVTPEKRKQTIYRPMTREVPYKYVVQVPYVEQQKVKQPYYNTVTKEVPYKYVVQVPYTAQEKVKERYYNTVTKQVPYKYNVQVPVVTQEKRVVTEYVCVPQEVVSNVTVYRRIPVPVVDCCGCCRMTCQTVTEVVPVRSVVMQRVAQNREIMVNVCNYRTEERAGAYTTYETVAAEREVVVNVCRYRNEERAGSYTTYETVAAEREVVVNVCRYRNEERVANRIECYTVTEEQEYMVNVVSYVSVPRSYKVKRLVCNTVAEQVVYTQSYCEMEAYPTTVRVPVPVPCCSPCH